MKTENEIKQFYYNAAISGLDDEQLCDPGLMALIMDDADTFWKGYKKAMEEKNATEEKSNTSSGRGDKVF